MGLKTLEVLQPICYIIIEVKKEVIKMTVEQLKNQYPDFFSDRAENWIGTQDYEIDRGWLICKNTRRFSGEAGKPEETIVWAIYEPKEKLKFGGTFSTRKEAEQAIKKKEAVKV